MQTVKSAVGLSSKPRLAWIGLGNMGRGMIKNLVEKGSAHYASPIQIHNRTRSRADKLASTLPSGKVAVAPTVADAVSNADIIFTCVGDDAAITGTVDEALKVSGVEEKLFVDCSTVHPDTTNKLAQMIEGAGAAFVACPVFGPPAMADVGQLVCVLAGPREQVDRVRPFCKGVMGRAEIDFAGQAAGNASRLKIVGNTFILQMIETLSEGHTLAEKSGLGVDNLHQFIEMMFPAPFAAYSNRLRSGDYYLREEPAFDARLAQKDWRHAMDLAKSSGVRLKGLEVAGAHLQDVVDYAGAKGDITGVYGAVRREAGLEFENQK